MLKISSFYSSIVAFVVSTLIILVKRKDLMVNSLVSGFLMIMVGVGVYLILFIIYPEFIQRFWYLEGQWYFSLLFGVPLAEYIWYFLAGAFIGPLYEYWKEGKLINLKN